MLQYLIVLFLFFGCNGKNDEKVQQNTQPVLVPFNNVPDTDEIVMYQVNPRAFSPSGDITGITKKLDHIKSLGVNVIWLMPLHPIGKVKSVNSPYSISNYVGVNPEFGTLTDLVQLVAEAHNKDMAVILDWVANHTAWDHPWIKENPSWYEQDANGDIIIPPGTNWQDVAQLNFNNISMRREMIKAMRFWIEEVNIDGFRCDAVDFLPMDFWSQAISSLNEIPERKLIWLAETGRESSFDAGFDINYAWDFNSTLQKVFKNGNSAGSIFTTHLNEYSKVPPGKHKLRYTTNHDLYAWDGSVTEFYNNAAGSLAAFCVTAFLEGVPLIYNGQELAVPGRISFFESNPINWSNNHEVHQSYEQLMDIRIHSPAIQKGNLKTFNHNDVVVFEKTYEGESVLVIVNVRPLEVNFPLSHDLQNTTRKDLINDVDVALGTQINLLPYEYMILRE